jgi:hypothetical protein
MESDMNWTIDREAITEALGGLDKWSHQCHGASIHLVKSGVLGTDCRVARGSCPGVGGQHSWVVLGMDCYDPTAKIIDPTLWSYDPTVDGVWMGLASERPHTPHGAGSIWNWGRPESGDGEIIGLAANLSPSAEMFLDMVGPLDIDGWVRLFSLAPVEGWPAGEIIEAAWRTPDLRALIPIDRVGMLTTLNPEGLYLAQ